MRRRSKLGGDRPVVRRVGPGNRVAGHADVHAAVMSRIAVRHRAHQTIAIGQTSQAWQVLADPRAGHHGRNGLEWPADLGGSIRLQIEAIDMAAPAILDDEDARSAGREMIGVLRSFRSKKLGKPKSNCANAAELQELPAADADRTQRASLHPIEHTTFVMRKELAIANQRTSAITLICTAALSGISLMPRAVRAC